MCTPIKKKRKNPIKGAKHQSMQALNRVLHRRESRQRWPQRSQFSYVRLIDVSKIRYPNRVASNDKGSIRTNPMFRIFKPLRGNPNNPFDFVATINKKNKGITHYRGSCLCRGYIDGLHRGYKGEGIRLDTH